MLFCFSISKHALFVIAQSLACLGLSKQVKYILNSGYLIFNLLNGFKDSENTNHLSRQLMKALLDILLLIYMNLIQLKFILKN